MSLMLPYSCLQLSICSAYAERGSLFLMYRVCSRNLDFKLHVYEPTEGRLQVRYITVDTLEAGPFCVSSWPYVSVA